MKSASSLKNLRRYFMFLTLFCALGMFQYTTAATKSASISDGKTSVAYRDNGATIIFGNGIVELTIVSKTGYIRKITNKVSGREYKLENDGSWPFGMDLGFPNVPKFLIVEVVGNTPHPQNMVHETVSVPGGEVLKLEYDNLLSSGGALTGIKIVVDISLKAINHVGFMAMNPTWFRDDADYFLIKADPVPEAVQGDFVNSTVVYNERAGVPAKKFEEIIGFVTEMVDSLQTPHQLSLSGRLMPAAILERHGTRSIGAGLILRQAVMRG